VGGGYIAECLGKKDWQVDPVAGDLELARIPGYEMYCVARAAGVPLLGTEPSGAFADRLDMKFAAALKPLEATVEAFDRYYKEASILVGPVEDMAHQHMSLYFTHRWRFQKLAEVPEMKRALRKPNPGVDYAEEPAWMQDTQVALIHVIANLCREIERRINQGGTRDEVLRQPLDASVWEQLSGSASGAVVGAIAIGPLGAATGATVGLAASGLVERQRLLKNHGAEVLGRAALLAKEAPEYLKRWHAWLKDGLQADVRDTAVERDGIRLLEALQTAPLHSNVVRFFDEFVHDSMAGFIGFGMPEFEVNGYGIAKFRRIFFGDDGDDMLRKEAGRGNKQRIAAADKRRFDRARWDLESRYNPRL
jgi:hypothetical protein